MENETVQPARVSKTFVPRCHLPWQEMIIQADGTVEPCCYWTAHGNSNPPLGNVNENTIEEIWNGKGYRRLRRNMADGKLKAAGCANCFALKQGQAMGLEYDGEADAPPHDKGVYAQNINTLKAEIAAGADTLKAKPTIVSATASHKCNLACTHCYQNSSRSRAWKRKDVFAEIEKLTPTLVRLIAGGGEPLLFQRWRKFIAEFDIEKAPLLNFGMTTNATVLKRDVLEGLKKFKSLHIIVSMDGASPEIYNKIRINGDFREVEQNIRTLKKLVDSRPKSTVSTFGLCMSVMKSNINHMPDFIRWAAREGLTFSIHPVLSLPLTESLAAINDPQVVPEWRSSLDEARRLISNIESDTLPDLWRAVQRIKGRAAWSTWPYLGAFESFIPWNVEGKYHSYVTGRLPKEIMDLVDDRLAGKPLVVVFTPISAEHGTVTYYSRVEQGAYAVQLPFGAFRCAVIDEFDSGLSVDAGQFVVRPSSAGFEDAHDFLAELELLRRRAGKAAA